MKIEAIGEIPVRITNFINPHYFNFKLHNVMAMDPEAEKALRRLQMTSHQMDRHQYKQDDMVVAFIPQWDKWIRAEIDFLIEKTFGPTEYVIWCTDYG